MKRQKTSVQGEFVEYNMLYTDEINKMIKSIREIVEELNILLDAAKRVDMEVKFTITENKTQDVKAIIYNMEDMTITSQFYTKQEIL
jgi:hypothetical protein